MFGIPLAFGAPAVLIALAGLGALYYLLRVTPPPPRRVSFPPLRLLLGLSAREREPARTPWPILALRLAIATLVIVAMAQPLWRALAGPRGSGPLLVLVDNGWPAAPTFDKRIDFAQRQMAAAARAGRVVALKPFSETSREIAPLDAGEIEGRLHALLPAPYMPPRAAALPAIERFLTANPGRTCCGSPTGRARRRRRLRRPPRPSRPAGRRRRGRVGRTRHRGRCERGWDARGPARPDSPGSPRRRGRARARRPGPRDRPRAFRLRRQGDGRRPLRPAG